MLTPRIPKVGPAVAALVFAAVVLAALGASLSDDPFYRNYWGGLVYAPFALASCVLAVVLLVLRRDKAGLNSRQKKSGKQLRRERQAARHRPAIEDWDKPWRGGT
jgi:hypothetical protein